MGLGDLDTLFAHDGVFDGARRCRGGRSGSLSVSESEETRMGPRRRGGVLTSVSASESGSETDAIGMGGLWVCSVVLRICFGYGGGIYFVLLGIFFLRLVPWELGWMQGRVTVTGPRARVWTGE
jgi:hypothetical protein